MDYYKEIKQELINNEINRKVKEYSKRLIIELGSKYNETLLKRIRKFYLLIEKGATLSHQLSWSHYQEILSINNLDKINYYLDLSLNNNLSIRQLREKIKNKEYERVPGSTKNKLLNKEDISIEDNIKKEYIIKYSSDKRILVREYEFI